MARSLAPDIILMNGKLTTFDDETPDATALAIKDGLIIAVGGDSLADMAGDATKVVNLAGRRVVPGINDTHNHVMMMGKVLSDVQLYDARSIADIQERVAAAVESAPPGAWITGRGWDESLLSDQRFPNRHDLDEVAPNNPVVLDRVWNMLVANSAALNAADISRSTPDPPADQLYAGRIVRDANGDPTGVFRDRAKHMVQDVVPLPTLTDKEGYVRRANQAYNALGITSAAEPGLMPDQLRAYQNVRRAGHLSVRTSLCLGGWGFGTVEDDATVKQRLEDTGVYTGFGDGWLRFDTVKFMPDGGIGDRTALMYEHYADEPENYGQQVFTERQLTEYVNWVHERGWSIDSHTCGDRMQEMAVQAFAAAQVAMPAPTIRHRVHHAYLPTAATLELMAEHRIPALATIPFLYNLGESFVTSLGEERAAGIMPLRTYIDSGVPLALGSDAPVTTYDPWTGLYTAVTRKTVTGRQLGAGERISRIEALQAYTKNAAWVTFEDDCKGTLSVGKWADLAVLSRDVLEVPEEDILGTTSVLTIVDGRIVHDTLAD